MLRSSSPGQISEALRSGAYYDPDWRWVQSQCLYFLVHADSTVRRDAAACLGVLAMFHKKLDVHVVVPALQKAVQKADEDPEVKSSAEDSLEEIRHSLKLS